MICLSATSDDIRGVSFKCGHREIDKYFEEKLLTDSDAVSYCFWADADKKELIGICLLYTSDAADD